jgi:hypothetical protein
VSHWDLQKIKGAGLVKKELDTKDYKVFMEISEDNLEGIG